ncbi:hypothetical protein EC9_14770 [Rosistilla ulvae]|uniref:Uncharacterized protein n=1 Tax=Rosistilla ulvae TaxID=1930277 RepID=A0A517LXG0_9BACT|nr:hypothetical protein EC9_14770 [Rosistilla ulvae]
MLEFLYDGMKRVAERPSLRTVYPRFVRVAQGNAGGGDYRSRNRGGAVAVHLLALYRSTK